MRAALSELAERINSIAISTIEEDGTHAAMFFLRQPDGSVDARMFESTADPPGDARAQEMAEAVTASSADAVVFVSEAWRAHSASVPEGGRARDAEDADDILLVVALDRLGNQLVFETTLSRGDDAVRAVETETHGPDYVVHTLNRVRGVWELPQRMAFRGGAFSAAVPPGWIVSEDGDTVQLEPPSRLGAAHFSIYRRAERREPTDGEATDFVQRVARSRGIDKLEASERRTRNGLAAVALFDEGDGTMTKWIVGAHVSPLRAVLYTYNDDGSDSESRDRAVAIFESVAVGST